MNIKKIFLLTAPPVFGIVVTGSYTSLDAMVAAFIGSLMLGIPYYLAYWLSNGFQGVHVAPAPSNSIGNEPYEIGTALANPAHPLHKMTQR